MRKLLWTGISSIKGRGMIELIKTADGRIIGAQVKTHVITRPSDETEKDFITRMNVFAENISRLADKKKPA